MNKNKQTILVTGGAGYIGSHTVLELLDKNYSVVILDNLSNSSEESINRVKEITGKEIIFYNADLLNYDAVENIFNRHKFDSVIHFAGLKAVGESVSIPIICSALSTDFDGLSKFFTYNGTTVCVPSSSYRTASGVPISA